MNLRKPTSRWAFWLLAAALLLNGAMPLLASASAHAQGKSLVEVCTVYGVSLVSRSVPGHDPASDHAAPHASEHCALTALTALATLASPEPPAITTALVLLHKTPTVLERPAPTAPDACATWVARLRHGPPIFS